MSNLSPVEALQQAISEAETALSICVQWPLQVGEALHTQRVLLSALKFIKAYDDYQEHFLPDDSGSCVWCVRFKDNLETAHSKFHEALQR
jgi:hypothetical protein